MRRGALVLMAAMTAGACGGTEEEGGPSCAGAPCASDVTGTWTYTASCGQGGETAEIGPDGCIQAAVTLDHLNTDGSLTFAEGGAWAIDVDEEVTFTVTAWPVCPEIGIDCVGTQAGWAAVYDEAACAEDGFGGCTCTATNRRDRAVSGTWTAEGSTVIIDDGISETVYESCVSDDPEERLWLRTTEVLDGGEYTSAFSLARVPDPS